MNTLNPSQRMYTVLRIACSMCLIGHGAFGVITKPIWCNYFAVFGIGKDMAYTLMPVVGMVDIVLGITMLTYPMRAVAAWLVFWGLFTASLRPLSGEPFAECMERAGNYGAPLALLLLTGLPANRPTWFQPIKDTLVPWTQDIQTRVRLALQAAGALLLAGHGWLNLIHKQGLLTQYTNLGFSNPVQASFVIGLFELAGALVILLRPQRWLILILFGWKVTSEVFYPSYAVLEWVERGGSYAVLLSLCLLVTWQNNTRQTSTVNMSLGS